MLHHSRRPCQDSEVRLDHFGRCSRRPWGSRRDAVRLCTSGRSASRMSWNSPSVVSNFSGLRERFASSCEARLPRRRRYTNKSSTRTTVDSAIRAGSTGGQRRVRRPTLALAPCLAELWIPGESQIAQLSIHGPTVLPGQLDSLHLVAAVERLHQLSAVGARVTPYG